MFREHSEPGEPATPCDVCGEPANSRVWDINTCHACVADWSERAKANPPVTADDDFETVCAKYTAWTKDWAAQRRRTARAA